MLLAAPALAGVVAPQAARAAGSDGTLFIRGFRTAYVDVTLVRPTTEPLGRAAWQSHHFTTTGTYAIWFMKPVTGDGPTAGGSLMAAWKDFPLSYGPSGDDRPLPAGTYHLYLFTDGKTAFNVPLPGYGDDISAIAVEPFASTAFYQELGPGSSSPQIEVRHEFTRSQSTAVALGVLVESTQSQTMYACVTAHNAPRDTNGGCPGGRSSGSSASIPWIRTDGPMGDVDALWDLQGGQASRRSLFFLAADLPTAPAPNLCNVTSAGYWLVAGDGGIFPFGDAPGFGSTGGMHLNQPIVGMAPTPDACGYWLVAADGGVFPFGDAGGFGSTGGIKLNRPIVSLLPTPDGQGYWLVASDGGIFPFGDAGGYGSTGGMHLNRPIVAMTPTPDGNGYWLVASDGGVFPFGDARGYGSTGGMHLSRTIVAIAPTQDGLGYWLTAADGGIFPFGDAAGYGSMAGTSLTKPVVGMTPAPDGSGYWLVASDGGVVPFGDAAGYGSTGGIQLNQPIVGVAAIP